jgi:hypothetical protein
MLLAQREIVIRFNQLGIVIVRSNKLVGGAGDISGTKKKRSVFCWKPTPKKTTSKGRRIYMCSS